MKKLVYIVLTGVLGIFAQSCDKVENPIKPSAELDSTLYPGDWETYVVPIFSQNTNTARNVLVEDYTGHQCGNCPLAADKAKEIEDANPERAFVASIHASPAGMSGFQALAPDCGMPSNPEGKYCAALFCDEGLEYGQTFGSGYGFIANPQGNVSRKIFGTDPMFQSHNAWAAKTTQIITENDLKVNIQAKSNYYTETNGLFLHTETEFLEDMSGSYSMIVYLIENEVIDYQLDGSTDVPDYHHHNVFRGCLDGETWGRSVTGGTSQGDKTYLDYSYKLPDGKSNSDYHLLIYVYDESTYEILQVIKHEF